MIYWWQRVATQIVYLTDGMAQKYKGQKGLNIQPTQVKYVQLKLYKYGFRLSFVDVYFYWEIP